MGRLRLGAPAAERLGYALIALVLVGLLGWRVRQVDGMYLDEWFYVGGGQYMWEHMPFGVFEPIEHWNRGPQRLYSLLLGLLWGPFGTSRAYDLSHLLNVLLLVSGIVPLALFARRVIESPGLRVLAVALGAGVPWLTISAHLLTENLAFPLVLWAVYLIVRAAEEPGSRWQLATLAIVLTLTFVRLNLVFIFLAFVLAVLVAELQTGRRGGRLQRRWPTVAAVAAGAVVVVYFAVAGSGSLGAYGGVPVTDLPDRIFGETAADVRRTGLTYSRWLLTGGLVLPLTLGFAVALAGTFGRLGPRLTVPCATALGCFVAVVGAVSVYTSGAALEERYVFYAYSPMVVLAVAGLPHLARLPRWLAASGVLALWTLVVGAQPGAFNSGHFFASPSGAFWGRVVHHRLRAFERDYLGWTLLPQTGWLLIAIGLCLLVAVAFAARRSARWPTPLVTAALAVCAVAQVAIMNYSFKQELFGTKDAPGGIALSDNRALDRETFVDAAVPGDARAAVQTAVLSPGAPFGRVPELTFWNEKIDVTLATEWNGSPVPAPPGFRVNYTEVGEDGLAAARQPLPPYLVATPDDPRMQFDGELVARSPLSTFAVLRTGDSRRAVWTADGLQADAGVLEDVDVQLTLDRAAAQEVDLTLRVPEGAPSPVRWRIRADGRTVAAGRLVAGAAGRVRLTPPPCRGACETARWELSTSGVPSSVSFPGYGYPLPPRPLMLYLDSARLVR